MVITFVETQSNLRKANVQLLLSANSSPTSGTPIICLQGTLEQLDLEQKPSSTMTANKLGTGWKTERLGHHQTEGRNVHFIKGKSLGLIQEPCNMGKLCPPFRYPIHTENNLLAV